MKHPTLWLAAVIALAPALTLPSVVQAAPSNATASATATAKLPVAKTRKSAVVVDRTASLQFIEDGAESQCNLTFTLHAVKSGRFSVLFDYRDAKNFYAADFVPGSVSLRAVINGKTQQLAKNAVSLPSSSRVTLQRRRWTMRLVADKRVLATAYDATFDSGKIGSVSSGSWRWSDASVQPVEDIYWTDDFTRAPGQNGDWKASAANWLLTSSSEDSAGQGSRQHDLAARIEMSANPFAFHARANSGSAWAQTGRPFWDNYDASVSVKPLGRGTIGLAVYVQDSKNYLALQWSSTEGVTARQLVRVLNGKTTVLAQMPGAFLPRQWYRLSVRTSPGYIETFIDGTPLVALPIEDFGQGEVALLARGLEADFDDARVTSYAAYRQQVADGPAPLSNAWQTLGGSWRGENWVLVSAPQTGDKGASRLALVGRNDWDGYVLSVGANSGEAGACGLVAGYRDAGNYVVFRWAGPKSTLPFRGRQQFLRYRNGKPTVVRDEAATQLLEYSQNDYANLTIRLSGGALAVFSGERMVAQMADESLASGRVGVWAQGSAPVAFRDIRLFFPPEPQAPKVAPRFATDALMAGWASAAGEWPAKAGPEGVATLWNTGEFFGDVTIEYLWRRDPDADRRMEVALRARRDEWNSGYIARFADDKATGSLRLTLLHGERVLKQAAFPWKSFKGDITKPVPLRLRLEGDGILFSVGGKPAFSWLGSGAMSTRKMVSAGGTSLAARAGNFTIKPDELRAIAAQRDDYTFTEAPTDWYAPQGEWQVFSRWPCYSDWSFFGGKGLNPVLWTKRTYSGDTVAEMYAHDQMDLPGHPGYSRPGDLNITLAGDGKNPSSGYSFVVAGWDNKRTRILKGTQVVADNETAAARFANATNGNMEFHRHWFYIRAEAKRARRNNRDGVRLRLLMDDVVLCEYFDAAPLPAFENGGRVAIWTVDHGIMVARAKVESAAVGNRALPDGLLDAVPKATKAKPVAGATPVASATPAAQLLPVAATAPETSNPVTTLAPRAVDAPATSAMLFQTVPSVPVTGAVQLATTNLNVPASALVEEVGAVSKEKMTWNIRNPVSGGLFKVRLGNASTLPAVQVPLAVSATARIEADIMLPSDVQVDVYLLIAGVPHVVQLSGPPLGEEKLRALGAFEKKTVGAPAGTTGNWQHISFDLGAALQKVYPDAKSWAIEELSVGALHGDRYRWLGFGGNPLGRNVQLHNVRLVNG
jgi:hypothetical protein